MSTNPKCFLLKKLIMWLLLSTSMWAGNLVECSDVCWKMVEEGDPLVFF
jgi:hypothetical protein